MAKVNKKYCKDEDGKIFSPIVSSDSVIDENGKSLVDIFNTIIMKPKYHNYSTEEHIIGRWIDGKPLYEKTILVNLNVTIHNKNYSINYSDYGITNVDSIFVDRGSSFVNIGDQMFGLDHHLLNTEGNIEFFTNTVPTKTGIWFRIMFYVESAVLPYTITLKYTKTTDTADTPIDDSITATTNKELLNLIYPVGSIYISYLEISPETLFGGKWDRFGRGRTLIGVDETDEDFNQALIMKGEKTHTLTEDELPKVSGSAQISNSLVAQGAYPGYVSAAWGNMSATTGNVRENYVSSNSNTSRSANMKRTMTFKFGNDQPHNNIPPYITVFMWKRIS